LQAEVKLLDDNTELVLQACAEQLIKALEECGLVAEGYAKMACPVDTGGLRNSISHEVVEENNEIVCYIGTNMEYASYVEYGTGVYAEEGGRMTPWTYQDSKGEWHRTNGIRPQPYLRPAVSDHTDEYRSIVENELRS